MSCLRALKKTSLLAAVLGALLAQDLFAQDTAIYERHLKTFNVQLFGAAGDGSTNDAPSIQAAITAVPSTGGVVYFPPGTYLLTSTLILKSNLVLLGAAPTLSVLRGNGTISTLTRYNRSDGLTITDVSILDLGFDLNGYNTKDFAYGIALNTTTIRRVRIVGNRFFDSAYPGDATVLQREWILVLPAEDVWITDNDLSHGGRIHVGAGSGAVVSPTRNVWIVNNKIDFVNDNAITFAQAGTIALPTGCVTEKIYVLGNTILNPKGVGIFFGMDGQADDDPTATLKDIHVKNNTIWIEGFAGKTPDGISVTLPAGANAAEHIVIEGNTIRSTNTLGTTFSAIQVIRANNPVGVSRWITIRGNHISLSSTASDYFGINIAPAGGVADLSIDHNLVSKGNEGIRVVSAGTFARLSITNNRLMEQNGAQIDIRGDGVIANGRIEGNWLSGQAGASSSNAALNIGSSTTAANYELTIRQNAFIDSASKGIRLASTVLPTVGGFLLHILDNEFTGNAATIDVQVNAAFATGSQRRRNRGYVTEASGTGTINSGATTATITHGLSLTPVAKDIVIGFTENPTNDPGNFWISGITSTLFVLNVRTDPGASNLDFTWQATAY